MLNQRRRLLGVAEMPFLDAERLNRRERVTASLDLGHRKS